MQWRGRELTEDSWVCAGGFVEFKVVRAGDRTPDAWGAYMSHLSIIERFPDTPFYRWPTTEELIKHFGEQHAVQGP